MKLGKLTKALCLVFVLVLTLAPTSVFAASPSNGDTQTTDVSYTVAETEWTWSVPAAQTFTDSALTKTGDVAISPVGDVIALASGTSMSVSMTSANSFKLINGVSEIPYTVSAGSLLANNATVLTFTAGSSDNTGVSQTLTFATTVANIQNATLTGSHTDTLTFTLSVVTP